MEEVGDKGEPCEELDLGCMLSVQAGRAGRLLEFVRKRVMVWEPVVFLPLWEDWAGISVLFPVLYKHGAIVKWG